MQSHPFRGTAPFHFLSASLLAGHFASLLAGPGWSAVAGILLLATLASVSLRFPARATALFLLLFCGAFSAGRVDRPDPETVLPFLEQELVMRGTVDSVRQTDSGWSGTASDAILSTMDGASSIRLEKVSIHVRAPDAPVSFPAGMRATGRLHPIRSAGNPYEMPREWGALASGVRYTFSSDAGKTVFLPLPGGGDRFARSRHATGLWLDRVAGRSDGALYLRSLANGEVPPPGHPLVVLLRNTGLAHLLAISGVNVVIFYFISSFLIRASIWLFRRRQGSPELGRLASVSSLPVCWGYVLMSGASLPAVRSAGMVTVSVLCWQWFGRRSGGFAFSLVLAATVAVVPTAILSPAFQLSFGAVFFLIATAGVRAMPPGEGWRRAASRIRCRLVSSLEGAGVAFFGTLPISVAWFQGIPLGSIGWNLLFGPILGTAGVAGSFLAVVASNFGIGLLESPVRWIAMGMDLAIGILRSMTSEGTGYRPLPPAGWISMTVAVTISVVGVLLLRTRGRPGWPAPVGVSILFLAWIHLPYLGLPDWRFALDALNVGKGASHVVRFPGGATMVIDCGSADRGDAGRRILLPYLRSEGIRRIDVLVLTHPHEDHFGGAAALLEALPVREIWIPDGCPRERFGPAVASYPGIVRAVGRGYGMSSGGASVNVRSAGDRAVAGANGTSLVLEASIGRFSAWLPGDIEGGPGAWGTVPEKGNGWRILFLPHHGSAGADPDGWRRAATPDVSVIQNRNCLDQKNLLLSDVFFALENGAVSVRTDGRSVSVRQGKGVRIRRMLCRLP